MNGLKVLGIVIFWYGIILILSVAVGLLGIIGSIVSFFALILSLLLSASLPLFVNVSIVRFAKTKRFFKAITISEVVSDIRKKLGEYLALLIAFLVFGFILQEAGTLWFNMNVSLESLVLFFVVATIFGVYIQTVLVKFFARVYFDA
jgi:hypothetical protein